MAQLFTDFGFDPLGQAPPDWTNRYQSTSQTWAIRSKARRVLEHTSSTASDYRRGFSYDPAGNPTDVELLTEFRTSNTSGLQGVLAARASGSAGNETCYRVWLQDGAQVYINRSLGGTSTSLANAAFTWSVDTWYRIRFQVVGTALRVRVWSAEEEEPAAWLLDITDSEIAAGGWCGVHNFEADGIRDWAFFGVGTDGDPALDHSTEPATGEARVTSASVQALGRAAPRPLGEARLTLANIQVLANAPVAPEVIGQVRMTSLSVQTLAEAEPRYVTGTVRLSWKDSNNLEEELRVYRSTEPMSLESLPAPHAVLPAGSTELVDHDAFLVLSYVYYRVGAVAGEGTLEKISSELRVLVR